MAQQRKDTAKRGAGRKAASQAADGADPGDMGDGPLAASEGVKIAALEAEVARLKGELSAAHDRIAELEASGEAVAGRIDEVIGKLSSMSG